MKTLILNIKQLVQTELSPRKWVAGKDMARLGILENAYLLVEEDKISLAKELLAKAELKKVKLYLPVREMMKAMCVIFTPVKLVMVYVFLA